MQASKKFLALVAVAAVSITASQQAAAREFADIYTDCGLGAMIAPNNAPVAAVTNITWDLGTTAVSSNVSSADTCRGGKVKTAAYIVQSYAQLEQDLARGEGPHLDTLMTVAGCTATTTVAANLRDGLASRVASPAYTSASRFEQAQALFQQVEQQADSCTL